MKRIKSLDRIQRISEQNLDIKCAPLSLNEALENICISYSPLHRTLHKLQLPTKDSESKEALDYNAVVITSTPEILDKSGLDPETMVNSGLNPETIVDSGLAKGNIKSEEPARYVLGHRKAFSLPRTLEVVNEDGSISHYPLPEVESPRSTLHRYGMVQVPVRADRDDTCSLSSLSSITGFSSVSNIEQRSEASSQADSGIQSQIGSSTSSSKPEKKGLTEIISKGISANWRIFSKSGQQVVKLMRRPESRETSSLESVASLTSVVSSQSLIMEDRPPGLPAKQPQEKEKHSQELQALVNSFKKKEKVEQVEKQRRHAEQRRQEDDLSSAVNQWTTQILPNWSTSWQSKRTQNLWWKGLPPPVRGRVWKLALDNQLNLTPQLYSILVTRARDQIQFWEKQGGRAEESPSRKPWPSSPCREETLELISMDVSRTFPQLCIFQKGGPYYSLLHNVLGAYVCYRPDLGYVQGMSFIAAILILNLEEEDAFILFANLVNRPPLSSFFTMDQPMMEGYYSSFSQLLSNHLPEVSEHLEKVGLQPDMYLLDWIMTLYGRSAPLDLACRIWDLMFRDGQDFIFKAALGILYTFQDRILAENDFTVIAQFLSKLPDTLSPDTLINNIQELNLQPRNKTFPSVFSRI
ncbi:TBC1 domain family member 12 [Eurytemora carolleeae]|uniref:TBC1 domain family member 12 n=1 Tax=Eurytemora carolleeae TaxID=1294199 RepID=UPI000C77A126|nr:TBC1 domain family member 12 [Eurytemora carolleeae]|eukprot:XP_023337041.1 TBC1 domain family member 12-like [Eurytemora affinis]